MEHHLLLILALMFLWAGWITGFLLTFGAIVEICDLAHRKPDRIASIGILLWAVGVPIAGTLIIIAVW